MANMHASRAGFDYLETVPMPNTEKDGPLSRKPSHVTPNRVVAITGSSSFLGRNLVGLLEEDPKVRRILSLDTTAPTTAGSKTSHLVTDLTHPSAEARLADLFRIEQVTDLVHLAFVASPVQNTDWAHETESIGTLRVVNACRRTNVRKLVMWSQTLLYGAHPTNPNFLTEEHALRARRDEPFFANKMEAENDVLRFGRPGSGRLATVLRTAAILGPTVNNFLTRYLGHTAVPTVLGFDPLWQFVHEADAVRAFKLALDHDAPGPVNIVGEGVLPLSSVVKLAGRIALPLPRPLGDAITSALWLARFADMPATFLDYLQYLCVADGERAARLLGFNAAYTTREALLDYASAQRQREAKLMVEKPA